MTSPGRDHGGSGSGACSKRENPGCCSGWRWCSSCARQAGGSRHCCSRSRRAPHDGRGPVRPPGPAVRAARTTRPGRSHGANATCQRAPRAPPRRAHPLLHLPPRDRTRPPAVAGPAKPVAEPPHVRLRQPTAPGRPQLEAEGNVAGAAVATTCVFAGCSDSRRRARNASSAVTPRREPRRVVVEQREVVDVAQIGRAEHLGDEVIEAVEVDVGEELARTDPATTGRPARAACK